jgi:hypothetical protein
MKLQAFKLEALEIVRIAYQQVGQESGTGFVYVVKDGETDLVLCESVSEALSEMSTTEMLSLSYGDFEEKSVEELAEMIFRYFFQEELINEATRILSLIYSSDMFKKCDVEYVTLRPDVDKVSFTISSIVTEDQKTNYDLQVYNPAVAEQDCVELLNSLVNNFQESM